MLILMVNIVLDGPYNGLADVNNDDLVNIQDIVLVIGIILGG